MIHVFDRGFAGAPWLQELRGHQLRFIMRWPTRYRLADEKSERPAWQITRGKRSQGHRQIWDLHQRQYRKTGIVAVRVRHPQADDALWLVVSRPGKGRKPWYLLTNETVETADDAWRVVMAYARRWQVEMCYRACKTDLAMESPRLWFWENRLKLLLMVSLVYAFLLHFLARDLTPLVQDLLRGWCHRTGKRYRQAAIPLPRLRAALSALWLTFPPPSPPLTKIRDDSCFVLGPKVLRAAPAIDNPRCLWLGWHCQSVLGPHATARVSTWVGLLAPLGGVIRGW